MCGHLQIDFDNLASDKDYGKYYSNSGTYGAYIMDNNVKWLQTHGCTNVQVVKWATASTCIVVVFPSENSYATKFRCFMNIIKLVTVRTTGSTPHLPHLCLSIAICLCTVASLSNSFHTITYFSGCKIKFKIMLNMIADGLRTCQINTACCFLIRIAVDFTCNHIKHCKMKESRICLLHIARN